MPAGADSPDLARIWFHQNVGGAFNPPTVPEDPNTGYPDSVLPGDPLCVESTLLFDFGFNDFAGFPNTHDAGLIILRRPIRLCCRSTASLLRRASSTRW